MVGNILTLSCITLHRSVFGRRGKEEKTGAACCRGRVTSEFERAVPRAMLPRPGQLPGDVTGCSEWPCHLVPLGTRELLPGQIRRSRGNL